MRSFVKLSLAAFVAATVAAGGVAPAFAGGSYYKGVSTTPINEGHKSEKYNPKAKVVNRPPPRNGAYYKGIMRK
ncbi:MAG TPA: hypothetical protein VGO04_19365 [Ensifer sp.]|jgi:hypothetical protein|uniref:hypothetical protein n=1 Tax=Ensifer sp. TaxID=1872086 RepID=UPI002E12B2ED|nr:hypothetical protein [Ensifer sp.]